MPIANELGEEEACRIFKSAAKPRLAFDFGIGSIHWVFSYVRLAASVFGRWRDPSAPRAVCHGRLDYTTAFAPARTAMAAHRHGGRAHRSYLRPRPSADIFLQPDWRALRRYPLRAYGTGELRNLNAPFEERYLIIS